MSLASRVGVMFGAISLFAVAQSSSAQPMAPSAPDALVRALQSQGIKPDIGFTMSRPANCRRGAPADAWAYHCVMALADSGRGGRTAALEVMIFKSGYDFAREDDRVKAAVAQVRSRWKVDEVIDVSVEWRRQKIALKASCHQALGPRNGLAYCLLPLSRNVLVFTQALPERVGTDQIVTSVNGGPDYSDDMRHAAGLASLASIAVAKAQQGGTPSPPQPQPQPQPQPPQRVLSDSIFRVRPGPPASGDDFCVKLKTALAAARTNFTSIPGPPDELIPGWRDAKLMLPYATDCYVETDKRDLSYFCGWQNEQSAAVSARYHYTVREIDQCLTGFQRTVGDTATTWRNPAIGSVKVDSRKVMKNRSLNSLMLTVRR